MKLWNVIIGAPTNAPTCLLRPFLFVVKSLFFWNACNNMKLWRRNHGCNMLWSLKILLVRNLALGFHGDAYMRANFLERHGLNAWAFRFVCEEWARAISSTSNRKASGLEKFFRDWVIILVLTLTMTKRFPSCYLIQNVEIIGENSRICFINVCAVLKLSDAFIRFTPLDYKRPFWVQRLVLPLLYKGIPTSNPRSTLVRLKTKGNRPMLADAR